MQTNLFRVSIEDFCCFTMVSSILFKGLSPYLFSVANSGIFSVMEVIANVNSVPRSNSSTSPFSMIVECQSDM